MLVRLSSMFFMWYMARLRCPKFTSRPVLMSTPSQYSGIIVNACCGGFGYSPEAIKEYNRRYAQMHPAEVLPTSAESYPKNAGDSSGEPTDPVSGADDVKNGLDEQDDEVEFGRHLGGWLTCDPIMVGVVKDLGDKASGEYASLTVEYVLNKYGPYITLHEYDGYETLDIDVSQYRIDRALEIARSGVDADTKVGEIESILTAHIADAIVHCDNPEDPTADL